MPFAMILCLLRIEAIPVQRVGCVLDRQWGIQPVAALPDYYSAGKRLVGSGVFVYVLEQGIVFVGGEYIASGTFCVKEIYVAVFHTYNKVDIKQGLLATLAFRVLNSVMLLAVVAVFIPPVDISGIGFEETYKFSFGV